MAQPDPEDASGAEPGSAPSEPAGGSAAAPETALVPDEPGTGGAAGEGEPSSGTPGKKDPSGGAPSGGRDEDAGPSTARAPDPPLRTGLGSAEAAAIAAETLAVLDAERRGSGAMQSVGAAPEDQGLQDDETTRVNASEVSAAVAAAVSAKSRTSSDERRAANKGAPVPAAKPEALPPLEKGQCPLCGTKNREDDVLCTGCGTTIATGEPPPVERFRPRRFDPRIVMVLGIVAVAGLLGLAIVGIVKTGADDRLLQKGLTIARGGDWRAAEREFEEAAVLGPENARVWTALAEARLRNGGPKEKLAEAAEKAVRFGQQQPGIDVGAGRFALGKLRLEEGRLDEASKLLEPAVRERPDLPSARHILGHCRFLRRETSEAIAAYEQALAADASSPEAPMALLRLGILYVERSKLVEAEKTLAKALAAGAPPAEAHVALGDLRVKKNDIDGALDSYEEAVKIDDRRAWTRFKMARLRLKRGEKQAALEDVVRAIAIDPSEGEFWKLEGRLRDDAGEPERAILAYSEAAKRNPKDAETRVSMARIEAKRGNPAKAKDELTAALKIDPGYVPALVELGDQASARKDWRAAVEAYKKAIASDSSRSEVHVKLARALEELGLHADAINAYREAVTVDPACVAAHEKLLEIFKVKRPDDARKTLVILVKLRPEEDEYKLQLAQMLTDSKEYPAAERLLEEVLKRTPGSPKAKKLLDKIQYLKFQEQPQ